MKKKLFILTGIMLLIIIVVTTITSIIREDSDKKDDKFTIVTSFYPMYILTKNITGAENDIEVVNLTENQTGCLHDYQLTTLDMKKLEDADVFVMNGGGMEGFMEDILKTHPDITLINASEGIEYLVSAGHDHDHSHNDNDIIDTDHLDTENSDPDHASNEELNAHVWLNTNNYLKQIQNVQDSLSNYDSAHTQIYQENGNRYQASIRELREELESSLADLTHKEVVIFHDSFAYLAEELGLEVVYAVNMDSDTSLSAGDIAEVVDEVNLHQVKVLFTEEQYSTTIADSISEETKAKVYVIDSMVTGDLDSNSYINAMRKNIEVIKEAFNQ